MSRFHCNDTYITDFRDYADRVLQKYGFSSQAAEHEIMCMAFEGNTVAMKAYADLLFYKKILRKCNFREAFDMYLDAGGLSISEDGTWECSHSAYPLAFWTVGYYLINYKTESYLLKCEPIDIIDRMNKAERMSTALELAATCISYINAPGAINLVGRILREAADEEELFNSLNPIIQQYIVGKSFPEISLKVSACSSRKQCAAVADLFFMAAADEGYVYACNNLASKEAERIIELYEKDPEDERIPEHIDKYDHYLRTAADKYEPYAANKLGLFYMTGEVKKSGSPKRLYFKNYVDPDLAKEYFTKATIHPDANSAWAFFNLIKYFPKDYHQNLELMNEHMEYIKALNPAVYDIAIDL